MKLINITTTTNNTTFTSTTSTTNNIYSFDLDDTIIPTSQHIHNLTIQHFSHLLPSTHTHPNCDPYQTLKDLLSNNLITQKQFDNIFRKAHILSIHTPFPHMINFINSLPQQHIHIITTRASFYKPTYIINTLQQHFPNKTIHIHNPNTHTSDNNASSTSFITSNATKHDLLFSLNKTHNITHFVDDLPFLHSKLINTPITLTIHNQPWTNTFITNALKLVPSTFPTISLA